MEIVMILCFLFCAACTGVLTYHRIHEKDTVTEEKPPFTDDEIDKIKQVLNLLTWGGENENQN